MHIATRPAAVAGLFYPADASALSAQIARLIAAVVPSAVTRPPKLLIVPHAGYVYSGSVAAHAYASLTRWRERIARVVMLGPAHRVAVSGLAAPTVASFETPFGLVDVDHEALAQLADLPQVIASDAAHATEHALEVQLPFLQTVLDRFTLVPLAVGRARVDEAAAVLERLWGGDETLIVISSDLSHYLPYSRAREMDRATVDRILRLDPALESDQACGAIPIAAALVAARKHGLAPRLLDLRNSGDTAGDRTRVVGYCAVAFEARATDASSERTLNDEHDADLGDALTTRARNAIAREFDLAPRPEPAHAALRQPGATFVTLLVRGQLRGCIGALEASRALAEDVRIQALNAAFRDSRFPPLRLDEFDDLEIEVSLVEPMQPLPVRDEVHAHESLRPGLDGVVLRWRGRSATFLPQVWDKLPEPSEFLAALKRKAGLSADFWASDLQLWRYQVRKFRELEPLR
jgi:AmmeMemoRadiSam system protein B/AmmeMemoRadiSam system protein A